MPPKRYRKAVAGVAALVGLAAVIGDSLAAHAAQHAADRSPVSVIGAEYSPGADGNGVDLLLDVADTSEKAVTVTQAQVQQSDLSLNYLGAPADLAGHQQLELGLWGQYDCSLQAAPGTHAAAARITVRDNEGKMHTVVLALPKGAQLPEPWRDGRSSYCAVAWRG